MTTVTGARWITKSMNDSPAAEPIRMLGGSPTSVAVPPILQAKICANRNG